MPKRQGLTEALREKNSLLAGNLALLKDGEKLQEEKNRLIVEKLKEENEDLKKEMKYWRLVSDDFKGMYEKLKYQFEL